MALKNLNRDRFPTHQFLRELRFLLSLNHPNIANCLALEQSTNGRQLVLDYCEGGTLRDLMEQETQLTLAEILTLMTEVLDALEHAQNGKIVHCDIKPENILLRLTPYGWQAKVSDFGIARLSQEFKGGGHTGATGSPAYMAPERFYRQYAIASDLYAVGVVLYEVLFGDRPFSGTYDQLMIAHLNHSVTIPATLPEPVRSLLAKSLEKLMARRFRNASEMKTAIQTARKQLTAADLRERFPKPLAPAPKSEYDAPAYATVAGADAGLHVMQSGTSSTFTRLLQFSGNTVTSATLTDTDSLITPPQLPHTWTVADPVQTLLSGAREPIAVTHHGLYRLVEDAAPKCMATFANPVEKVAGGKRWAMLQQRNAPNQFTLVDTRARVPAQPRPLPEISVQGKVLSSFDDRHLVVADVVNQATTLTIFSRWGKRLGRLHLNASLHTLIPSSQPMRLLACGGRDHQDFLIIRLAPYRVIRCRLGITVDWMGELTVGYVVISRDGHLRLVNGYGQLLGQVDGLPPPCAIAFHPPYQIWLASNHANEHASAVEVHCLDVRTLGLDIVF